MNWLAFALLLQMLPVPQPEQAFRDDQLHYSYSYPASLKVVSTEGIASKMTEAENDKEKKRTLSCVSLPFEAIAKVSNLFDETTISRIDLDCVGVTFNASDLRDFSRAALMHALARHGKAEMRREGPGKLSDHDAYSISAYVDESAKAPGQRLLSTLVCAKVEHSVVCWQVLSYTAEGERRLLADTVTFDGQVAIALDAVH